MPVGGTGKGTGISTDLACKKNGFGVYAVDVNVHAMLIVHHFITEFTLDC